MTRLSDGIDSATISVGIGAGLGVDVGTAAGVGVGCSGVEVGSDMNVGDGVEAVSVEHANKAKPVKHASKEASVGIGPIVFIPRRRRTLAVR